jgi:hypothetical protein
MPLAGFEPTIPVFKRAKTFHALLLGRAATVTGESNICTALNPAACEKRTRRVVGIFSKQRT